MVRVLCVLCMVFLIALATFCGFGVLAAREAPSSDEMRAAQLVYGVVGLACLAGAAWLARAEKVPFLSRKVVSWWLIGLLFTVAIVFVFLIVVR
jgi:uncharacterized membrane protein